MNDPGTPRAGQWCAIAAALVTGAAATVVLTQAAPQRWPLVVVLVAALAWGLGGAVAIALTPTASARHRDEPGSDGSALRIGVVMHLGGVPDEVARTTSAIAAASGPVALVVPPGRDVPELLDPAVVVVRPDDTLTALHDACDAVLFLSARALPAGGCRSAAAALAAGASWVVGWAEPLNRDRFGPTRRELLDARLRRRATAAGLWCWEPDATVVRTSLVRDHPFTPGRPLGSWLRERAAEGSVGATVDLPIARRAAPVAADGYWPDTTARQRAAAADLSDAACSPRSHWRARSIAAGLLLRALSGWSVALWLTALVLLAGGSPARGGEATLAVLVVAAAVLRWLAPHLAAGTRPAPMGDLVAGLYALPGSLAATASAVSRRVRPARRPVPTRPLVWLALVATAAAASVVLNARPGDGVARLAAGIAAVLLVLLWVFTVRSLVERSWRRTGFRIPLDLPATVDDVPGEHPADAWRVVDGSPGGFGLLGPVTGLERGDETTVRVTGRDDIELTLTGTVAGRRHGGRGGRDRRGIEMLGVELRSVVPGTAAWAATLLDGAAEPPTATAPLVDEHADEGRWSRWADRAVIGLVVGASITVALSLALVLIGLRPLVIRSGSMEPTYAIGDVVLVASERAGEVRTGQVVTRYDAPEAADSLTHRVQEVTREGGIVHVTTLGDANDIPERWSAPVDRQVGVVVASIPAIGLPLTAVRSSTGWAVAVGIVVLVAVGVLFRPRRRRHDDDLAEDDSLMPAEDVPTGSGATRTGEGP